MPTKTEAAPLTIWWETMRPWLRRLDYLSPGKAVALGTAAGALAGTALAMEEPLVGGVGFFLLLLAAGVLAYSGEPVAVLVGTQAEEPPVGAAENRRIPIPFLAGPVLRPSDGDLFRGHGDLVEILKDDVLSDRRGPILIVGQRRMGKSSLINLLSALLGTDIKVVSLSFQGLFGSQHQKAPHCWVAEVVAKTWIRVPAVPCGGDWGQTLAWLRVVEADLQEANQRLLVTIDEIECLQDGIREGWATADFLDFLRAAGDTLRRIRFLIATAYPLQRLGRVWVDRLINVRIRSLRPLDFASAEALIRRPMEGFPDIYPPGGVERIVEATYGHPYLLQLVCYVLCRRLMERKQFEATLTDIETAIDEATAETPLFHALWRERTDAERRVLQNLAAGRYLRQDAERLVRSMKKENFIIDREGRPSVMIPMFANWILDNT